MPSIEHKISDRQDELLADEYIESNINPAKRFSFASALRETLAHGAPTSLANREAHYKVRESLGKDQLQTTSGKSLCVPFSALRSTPISGADSSLFASTYTSDAGVLLPFSAVIRAGAQLIDGVTDQVKVFRVTTLPTPDFSSLPDGSVSVVATNPSFEGHTVKPFMLNVAFPVSNQLLAQSPVVVKVLTAALKSAFSSAFDTAVLSGSGIAGAPTGLMNDATLSAVTLAGATATAPELAAAESAVSLGRVADENIRFIASPVSRKAWRTATVAATVSQSIYEAFEDRIIVAPEFTDGSLIVGDFSLLQAFSYGNGLEVTFDPYARFITGETVVRAQLFIGFTYTQANAFQILKHA
jgi:hypothetical protein